MQDRFSEREVGITHPDVSSHVRLKDNGDIEIISGEGLGIVFNRKDRSMTFFADSVRMLTRDDDTGLRWNKLAFNPKATTYDQPAFIRLVESDLPNIYRGVGQFFGD
jgi:hypothetical protein